MSRASDNGVELFSLTDHDTLSGLSDASAAAAKADLRFVNGVEISCGWGGEQVHILAYAFDPGNTALNRGLAGIHAERSDRARRMSLDLEKAGIPDSLPGAMRYAENPKVISRLHFARYLVETGVCKSTRHVFTSYLVPGRPGYVESSWATIKDALGWILGAGGVASIAHPGRYKFAPPQMSALFEEFKRCGGQAVEVVSGSHSPEEIERFARLAREYGFAASCGSDFHGLSENHADLGQLPKIPAALTPIWEVFG